MTLNGMGKVETIPWHVWGGRLNPSPQGSKDFCRKNAPKSSDLEEKYSKFLIFLNNRF
jgi:hypothetical protein